MKNKVHHAFLLFILFPLLIVAQTDKPSLQGGCFTDQLLEKMFQEYPSFEDKHQFIIHQLYKSNELFVSTENKMMNYMTIPVIVHVVHKNGSGNISDQQVISAIEHLNDAFANAAFYDPNTGVNTEINFCLSIQDLEGNLTNGINRIQSSLTDVVVEVQDQQLKSLIQWDPLSYLNIWVVNNKWV